MKSSLIIEIRMQLQNTFHPIVCAAAGPTSLGSTMYLCYATIFILLYIMFLNVPPKDKGGKKTKKQSTSGKDQGDEAHGILDGISSLHTWIKTQTMIRPHPKSRGGKQGAMYDEVN